MGDRGVSVGVPQRARPLLVVLLAALAIAGGRDAAAQGRLVRAAGPPSSVSPAVALGGGAARRELRTQPAPDAAMLSVALRELRNLAV